MFSLAFVMIIPVSATGGLYEDSSGGVVLPSDSLRPIEPTVPVDPEPESGGSLISNVASIFGSVGSWIAGQLGTATSLFWNADAGALTFLGVLAVCALAIAVIFLIIVICSRFLRFRG